jgi:hypothetical protein
LCEISWPIQQEEIRMSTQGPSKVSGNFASLKSKKART